jgi:hypothetical protein
MGGLERDVVDVAHQEIYTANLLLVAGQQASSTINRLFHLLNRSIFFSSVSSLESDQPTKLHTRYSFGDSHLQNR